MCSINMAKADDTGNGFIGDLSPRSGRMVNEFRIVWLESARFTKRDGRTDGVSSVAMWRPERIFRDDWLDTQARR